jgi:hypothetical protein
MCAGRHSSSACSRSAGRSCGSTYARFSCFRNRSSLHRMVEHPVQRGVKADHIQDSGRASHTFFRQISGSTPKKGAAGSCDRGASLPAVPKSCFMAFGASLPGNLKLEPAFLKLASPQNCVRRINGEHARERSGKPISREFAICKPGFFNGHFLKKRLSGWTSRLKLVTQRNGCVRFAPVFQHG